MARDTYADVMSGRKNNNIRFADLQRLLKIMGFSFRVKGDHFIYWRNDIPEIINIQPAGSMVKAYQVKQIRIFFEKYGI
ncbi:MAG: type II toxin-antitoxin system HicA family toxin [Lachnospiraceae bacterium]|nr:type II toxin-antitoxin system HicA family toxin [Lachnospiraceae bacterium]